jgi:hypothetical protein
MLHYVHSSLIYHNQKLERTQMSLNRGMDRKCGTFTQWSTTQLLKRIIIFFLFQDRVSLCSPCCPQTQKSTCLCLLSAGIKGVCHHCLAQNSLVCFSPSVLDASPSDVYICLAALGWNPGTFKCEASAQY